MFHTPIGRLRLIGLIEGVSFLILLGIAMPLRAFAGLPEAVKITGWVHGVLFLAFVAAILHPLLLKHITPARAAGAFVASLVPFGTFVLDAYLRRDEQARHERQPVEVGG